MKIFFFIAVILYFTFKHLLSQSKNPSGLIGSIMMKLWNKVYLPMAKWCLIFLEEKQFDNILDIGVGNGATTKYISQNFIFKSMIGIDISEIAVEQAKNLNSSKNITFKKEDISETKYPSKHFDLVCAFQNHFHWANLQGSLLEIQRILTDQGVFLIGCEYSKIKYFLPDLKDQEAFKSYLNNLGLRLVQMEQKNDWIFYKIRKT